MSPTAENMSNKKTSIKGNYRYHTDKTNTYLIFIIIIDYF